MSDLVVVVTELKNSIGCYSYSLTSEVLLIPSLPQEITCLSTPGGPLSVLIAGSRATDSGKGLQPLGSTLTRTKLRPASVLTIVGHLDRSSEATPRSAWNF